jgi:hypothetical protein
MPTDEPVGTFVDVVKKQELTFRQRMRYKFFQAN